MPALAVVGAGPKGIAIAAKARALAAAGLDAPRVVLADKGPVAGNWSGRQGYTSGLLPLEIEYGTERERVAYDLVVVAIGFQDRWFEEFLGQEARRAAGACPVYLDRPGLGSS
jgi:hypothetical protein